MSGFEIAGIVLGALPVAVMALQLGNEAVESHKRLFGYKAVAARYLTVFEAEATIFKNTLTFMLQDITSAIELEELLKNPEASTWRDEKFIQRLKDKRLGDDYQVVMNIIQAIHETLEKFLHNLGGRTDLRGIKVIFKISKNGKVLDQLLDELEKHNQRLQSLAKMAMPTRTGAKTGKFFSRLEGFRKQILALHNAVQSKLNCACQRHEAGIIIEHDDLGFSGPYTVLFGTQNSQLKDLLKWRAIKAELVVLQGGTSTSSQIPQAAIQSHSSTVKSVAFVASSSIVPASNLTGNLGGASKSKPNSKGKGTLVAGLRRLVRRERTIVGQKPLPTIAAPIASTPIASAPISSAASAQSPKTITNICTQLSCPPASGLIEQCYGLLKDDEISFTITTASPDTLDAQIAPYSIQDWLLKPNCVRISFTEKLSLAVSLASATIGLLQTSWIAGFPEKTDLLLVKFTPTLPTRLCVVTKLRPRANPDRNSDIPKYIRDPVVFLLGISLIELIFGCPLDQLHSLVNYSPGSQRSRWEELFDVAALLLEEEHIRNEAGLNYEAAVKFCIHGDAASPNLKANLNDKSGQKAMYQGVIAPIIETVADLKRRA